MPEAKSQELSPWQIQQPRLKKAIAKIFFLLNQQLRIKSPPPGRASSVTPPQQGDARFQE
jgi:hypothetical protein